MKTTLVMGGTTFFGKSLVRHLLQDRYDVTIASRAQTKDPFGDKVKGIQFDRTSLTSMEQAFKAKQYDIVFDQIGYCADDMADACKVFTPRIGHYVFTSSIIVYCDKPDLGKVEEDFDPSPVTCTHGRHPEEIDYMQGKMQAEAYLTQNAEFPFASARFPMVMGLGDPTGRLPALVKQVLDRKPIVIPPNSGQRNYVEADDAGRFLTWLGATSRVGPYNAGSEQWIGPLQMAKLTGQILGIEPIILDDGPDQNRTDYAGPENMTVDVSKAQREGFQFTPFDQWYPKVVEETALGAKHNP